MVHSLLSVMMMLSLMLRSSRSFRFPTRLFSSDPFQELQRVSQEIQLHDNLYYNEHAPVLSDEDFDALVRREQELCESNPTIWKEYLASGQATRYQGRVGAAVLGRRKRQHLIPMLSLENAHNTEQLLAWLKRLRKAVKADLRLVTEPKLDGVSLSCRYEKGSFQWASTRGDGKEGQDVTESVLQSGQVPSTIPDERTLEIRGEVVLPQSAFNDLNQDGNLTFSNARNAASGILLRKEAEGNDEWRQKLRFYAYDIATSESTVGSTEARSLLSGWGYSVPEPSVVSELSYRNDTAWSQSDVPQIQAYHDSLRDHRKGKKSTVFQWGDYEMDGCVHKVDDSELRQLVGASTRAPRWAIAHKFPPQSAVTAILDVIVQVGRTGALTPVAVLEPVDLGGVKVQRATLHNFEHMQQILGGNSIPKRTQVLVRRAGEVIPQVMQRMDMASMNSEATQSEDAISLQSPESCPACGSPTVQDSLMESSTAVGQVTRCGGPRSTCRPQAIASIVHAFSRDALYLVGLSEARIDQLYNASIVSVPCDVFDLVKDEEKLGKLQEMEGWGKLSVQNLVTAAESISQEGVSLARFIYSMGIRHVGIHSSSLIASAYGSVDAFLDAVRAAGEHDDIDETFVVLQDDSEENKGIGPVLLASLFAFSKDQLQVVAAERLARAIRVIPVEAAKVTVDGSLPLSGLSVVFTGSLEGMTRTKAQEYAMELGAKSTPSAVSKATGLVVAGAKGGTKLEKAEKLGVRIISSEDFASMVADFKSTSS